LGDPLFEAQKENADPKRNGNRDPAHVPQDVYPCSGKDRWLAISIENDEAWRALCDCARLTHWSALSCSERIEKRESIDAALAEWTKSENSLALEAKLQAAGVIAAAVRDAVDLVDDPQLSYGPFWTRLPHPETGTHTQPGCPIRLEKTPASYRRPAAGLGEHNEEILIELLGADESLIAGLKGKRILIEEPP
jgi:crotonobetainyl-CoA:carnitine CoA-transferase CaiB-like acyl-CoA transferase